MISLALNLGWTALHLQWDKHKCIIIDTISRWEQWAIQANNGVEQRPENFFFFGYETANWDERQSLARRKLISQRLLWVAKAPSNAQLETVKHGDVSVEDLFSVSIEPLYKHSGYTNYICFHYLGYRKAGEQWKIPLLQIAFWEMIHSVVLFFCKHRFLRFVPFCA